MSLHHKSSTVNSALALEKNAIIQKFLELFFVSHIQADEPTFEQLSSDFLFHEDIQGTICHVTEFVL